MKIDIHAHTKKTKTGDAATRNVGIESFIEAIKESDVKILAITNHNHFDMTQYMAFRDAAKGFCDIWPGIELDIVEENRRGHLIVIVNPIEIDSFNTAITELLHGSSADEYSVSIHDMASVFNKFDAVYIAHYNVKKPALLDEDIANLCGQVRNKNRVIKEA